MFLTCSILSIMCPKVFSASLLPPNRLEFYRICRIFDDLGLTPRLCFVLLSNFERLEEYEHDVKNAVSAVTADRLENLIDEATSPTWMPFLPYQPRTTRRRAQSTRCCAYDTFHPVKTCQSDANPGTIRANPHIQIPCKGPWIEGHGWHLFRICSPATPSGLELSPMVHLLTSRKDSLPRWSSSHSLLRNTSLETLHQKALRQKALQEQLRITIRPSWTIEYPDDGLSQTYCTSLNRITKWRLTRSWYPTASTISSNSQSLRSETSSWAHSTFWGNVRDSHRCTSGTLCFSSPPIRH